MRYYDLQKKYDEKTLSLNEFLDLSKKEIDFGTVLSGYIIEEDIDIYNISNENIIVELKIECFDE